MSFHRINIDTDRNEAVVSADDSSIAGLPTMTQEDSLNLRIALLSGFSRISSYTPIATAGVTLQVALGVKLGNVSTYYTQQFSWTASDDLADPYFEAVMPMNTQAIEDLLDDGATAQAWFEVKMLDGGLPRTVLSKLVRIHAAVIKDGGMSEPAEPTPLSVEAANVIFLKRLILCSVDNPVILENEVTGLKTAVYTDEDGSFHADAIV